MAKQTFTTGQVLTAAQMNSLQANDYNQTVDVKTANYTLVAADKGKRIEFNTSGSVTCTVNTGLFDAGDTVIIQNRGAGSATITAGTATVNTNATLALGQYAAGTLYFVSASAAIFFGDASGIAASAFTAKGDLLVGTGNGTFNKLTVGANNTTIVADSGAGGGSVGLKWAVDPVADIVTTAGDILYATAADTLTRLGIGTAGQVLKVNSGATAPEWGAAGGASFVGCKLTKSAQQTVNNTTETAITWNQEEFDTDGFHDNSTNTSRITIPSGKAGKYLFVAANIWTTNSTGQRNAYLKKNGNTINSYFYFPAMAAGATAFIATNLITLAEGDYIELFGYHSAGTTINFDSDGYFACQYLGA